MIKKHKIIKCIIFSLILLFIHTHAAWAIDEAGEFDFVGVQGGEILSNPIVDDIDNDGQKEIFFVTANYFNTENGQEVVLNSDLELVEDVSRQIPGNLFNPFVGLRKNYPVIGDLNRDGIKEVVYVFPREDLNATMVVRQLDGNPYPHWPEDGLVIPFEDYTQQYHFLSLMDLDRDGTKEIINCNGERLTAYRDNSKVFHNFHIENAVCDGHVGFADLDADGKNEIIAATWDLIKKEYLLNAFNPEDMTQVQGWPVRNPFSIYPINETDEEPLSIALATGDVDADGRMDVVASACRCEDQNNHKIEIQIRHQNGRIHGGWPRIFPQEDVPPGGNSFSAPALGDLNNDKKLEIAFVTKNENGEFCKFEQMNILNSRGDHFAGPFALNGGNLGQINGHAPTIADMDGDNQKEVFFLTGAFCGSTDPGTRYLNVFTSEGEFNEYILGPDVMGGPIAVIADLKNDGDLNIIKRMNKWGPNDNNRIVVLDLFEGMSTKIKRNDWLNVHKDNAATGQVRTITPEAVEVKK